MQQVEKLIGYTFKNPELLKQALTHSSYASEHKAADNNERLEFLGDAVAGLATVNFLYLNLPNDPEGRLAKLKNKLVSRSFFAVWAREINIGTYLYLGEGEKATGGRDRNSILSNTMEALIGAVFLDGGYEAAETILTSRLETQAIEELELDYKSVLQENVQKKHKVPPIYEILSTMGPEHNKIFTVEVKVKNKTIAKGKGNNKKEAEQEAAKAALEKFNF
jgi:ribonuclease-3